MAEPVPDYGEPWRDATHGGYVDRHGGYLMPTIRPGGIKDARDRAVACVNALAGLPVERLEAPSRELSLFKAWLVGDDDAAALAADSLLDERQAEAVPGYVSREKLLGLLKECLEEMHYLDKHTGHAPRLGLVSRLQNLLGVPK